MKLFGRLSTRCCGVIGAALVASACGAQQADSDGDPALVFPTVLSDIRVINPGMVAVDFVVENNTDSTRAVRCDVAVIDPDGAAQGSDTVTISNVAAGAQQPATVQIGVSAEGAEFITEASLECLGL